ncbi:unnamed protein product [Victoria cruziana]
MKIGIRFYWNLDFPKYCNCSASFFFPSAVTLHGTISASLLFPISGHGLRTSIQHSALKMIRAQDSVAAVGDHASKVFPLVFTDLELNRFNSTVHWSVDAIFLALLLHSNCSKMLSVFYVEP